MPQIMSPIWDNFEELLFKINSSVRVYLKVKVSGKLYQPKAQRNESDIEAWKARNPSQIPRMKQWTALTWLFFSFNFVIIPMGCKHNYLSTMRHARSKEAQEKSFNEVSQTAACDLIRIMICLIARDVFFGNSEGSCFVYTVRTGSAFANW